MKHVIVSKLLQCLSMSIMIKQLKSVRKTMNVFYFLKNMNFLFDQKDIMWVALMP